MVGVCSWYVTCTCQGQEGVCGREDAAMWRTGGRSLWHRHWCGLWRKCRHRDAQPWQCCTHKLHLFNLLFLPFFLLLFILCSCWRILRHSVRMSLGICPAEPRNWKWPNCDGKSEMSIFLCISITNNVKTCKKFNESTQTTNFIVFTRGHWWRSGALC